MIIFTIMTLCFLAGIWRINKVSKFRMELISKISDAQNKDIKNLMSLEDIDSFDVSKRWSVFDKVSFDSMAWKFWKPLNSFYTTEQLEIMTDEDK